MPPVTRPAAAENQAAQGAQKQKQKTKLAVTRPVAAQAQVAQGQKQQTDRII
jgi:hypothetical protein